MTALQSIYVGEVFAGEVHRIAAKYPLLPADEFEALRDDIAANGLQVPITLDSRGRLVDGRNRLAACEAAGVEPRFEARPDLDSDAAAATFIRGANNRRRHMSTGQTAAADALTLIEEGKRRGGRWMDGSAQDLARSEQEALRRAGVVADWEPHLLDEVLNDRLALDAAYRQAKETQEREDAERLAAKRREAEAKRIADENARKLAELREKAPDLAAHVDGGQPITEAWAAYRERTRKAREAAEAAERNRREAAQSIAQAVHTLAHRGQHAYSAEAITSYRHDDVPNSLRITRRAIDDAIAALNEFRKDARIA